MSAREELVSTLTDLWLDRCGSQVERNSCRPDAEQLADAFAHELAEKQRARVAEEEVKGFFSTLVPSQLIDLIDPEVSS